MPATAHKPGRAAGTQTSPVLHVGRRVLTTPSRTIAIANISTVSVGTHVEHHPRALLAIAAVIFAAMAFGATQVGLVAVGQWNPVSGALGVVSVGLAAYALKPQDKAHYLLISSADGAMTQFKGRDRAMLDDVRRLIADKIDKGDETAVFDVNFETGDIGKEAGFMPRGEVQSEAGATPNSSTAGRLRNAIMTHARTGAIDGGGGAGRGAEAQAQWMPQNGASPGPSDVYVDFNALLPAVVEMHRFYARQPNAEHVEQRLSELELLMRAGAQTQAQKARVQTLTLDLAHILKAYEPAVKILHQISGMAA